MFLHDSLVPGHQQYLTEQYFYSSVCVHLPRSQALAWAGSTLSLLCIIVNAKKMGKTWKAWDQGCISEPCKHGIGVHAMTYHVKCWSGLVTSTPDPILICQL